MNFNNRWIDPRVVDVRPEDAQAYLLRNGWHRMEAAANPLLVVFEKTDQHGDAVTVLLPSELDRGPLLQRMIDLLADVSRVEDRWAGAILNDVLRTHAAAPAVPMNRNAMSATEPLAKS